MAENSKKFRSVVTNAYGSGPVVRGSRRNSGRVIGEQLSGGRNQRAPGPGLPSALRRGAQTPAPYPAPQAGSYSDFGLEDAPGGSASSPTRNYSGNLPQQRRPRVKPSAYVFHTLGTALGGLGAFFMFALAVVILGQDLIKEFPFLRVGLLPLLLAVYFGSRVGKSARRSVRTGSPLPAALIGGIIGVAIVGAGLFAWLTTLGAAPLVYAGNWYSLPREFMEYLFIIDEGVYRLFNTLHSGVYGAVPLFGAALGALFSRA